VTRKESVKRRKKLFEDEINNSHIFIDTANVIFTIHSYLLGITLYIADDGWIRDAAEIHGNLADNEMLPRSVHILNHYLVDHSPKHCTFCLDKLLDQSNLFREIISETTFPCPVEILEEDSADYILRRVTEGIVATSDSALINDSKVPVADLPKRVLEYHFHPELLKIPF
jgi:hypothetical protein